MRAILYPRISLEEGSQYGLPSQLRAMQEYAQKKGYQVIAELSEEFTGKTLDRPQLNRVREMARGREFDVLIAHSLDRLTRRMGQLAALRDELSRHQVSIEYVLMPTDDSIESRVMQTISEAFADYEREKIHERTLRGRREKARRGLIVGGRVPYGYDYAAGALRINEERAGIVRQIFGRIDQGQSIRAVAAWLRREGVSAWRGGKWGHSSVRRLLGNESYCGVAHYGTHKREGKRLKLHPDQTARISIAVPAIVARELWERVQMRLADRHRNNGRPTRRYLLRGLLWCACGKRMHGCPAHGSFSYRCAARDQERSPSDCRRATPVAGLDDAVWSAVSAAFSDGAELRRLVAEHFAELESEDGQAQAERLRKQIATLTAREDRALSLMLELDAGAALKQRYQAAREERRGLEAELAAIERARGGLRVVKASVDSLAAELREAIVDLDAAGRAEFLRRSVERITWDGQAAEIRCFFAVGKCTDRQDDRGVFQSFQFTVKARLAA